MYIMDLQFEMLSEIVNILAKNNNGYRKKRVTPSQGRGNSELYIRFLRLSTTMKTVKSSTLEAQLELRL